MKSNLLWAALLGLAVGVVLTSIVYNLPSKETTVVNEELILTNMMDTFNNLSERGNFNISYYPPNRLRRNASFYVNLNYEDTSHNERFDSYDEFFSFISSPDKYYKKVIEVRND